MSDLKPCPFENHIEVAEHLHSIGWKSPNDAQWNHLKEWCDEMAVAWNTRPAESALQKRVEELQDTIKRVEELADNWQQRLKVAQCNSRPDCIDWSRWKMCEQELKDALNGGGS